MQYWLILVLAALVAALAFTGREWYLAGERRLEGFKEEIADRMARAAVDGMSAEEFERHLRRENI